MDGHDLHVALSIPLGEKIDMAVDALKLYEPNESYHLAYSGGKDSGVILELAKMAGVKHKAVYSVTTLDPPELVWFIRRNHPEIEFAKKEMPMLKYMVKYGKGAPTRRMRWCCRIYKESVGSGTIIIGVRAAESPRRAQNWSVLNRNRKTGNHIICPIVYWTDLDVWSFHRLRGIPYCSLYDEEFKRLGCIGCPMTTKNQRLVEFGRWPRYEQMWQRHIMEYYEKWVNVPTRTGKPRFIADFRDWQEYYAWWLSAKKRDKAGECQMDLFQI